MSVEAVEGAVDYALAHGIVFKALDDKTGATARHTPFTLYPSPFSRTALIKAMEIESYYNELYMRVASDEMWLKPIMDDLAQVDDFTKSLWQLYQKVKPEICQHTSLGLFRSDYLLHAGSDPKDEDLQIKQVEFNTISVSFAGLSPRIASLHRYLLKSGHYPEKYTLEKVPTNNSDICLADGLYQAHQSYGVENAAILFVLSEKEANIFDQKFLEYHLLEKHGVKTHRISITRVLDEIVKDMKTKKIYYKGDEIALVYYRSAYAPYDYPSQREWDARGMLETSMAIKCPTLLTQLAGAKKIQQVLASDKELKRFVSKHQAEALQETFVEMLPLADPNTPSDKLSDQEKRAIEIVQDPELSLKYVLKPQREGGGNNIYRGDITGFVKSLAHQHWSSYIVMEIIEPPQIYNSVVKDGKCVDNVSIISELGIFGVALWGTPTDPNDKDIDIFENYQSGWLLRTKARESNEGGIAAGFGCLDSLFFPS